eukprot:3568208-Lingulodinium_polyedra.AAC.1
MPASACSRRTRAPRATGCGAGGMLLSGPKTPPTTPLMPCRHRLAPQAAVSKSTYWKSSK